jgi:hypothetical protein
MISWQSVIENVNSHYRNDYFAKVTCDWLLITVENNNLTDEVAEKFEMHSKQLTPLDALTKACEEFNIKQPYD